MNFITKKGIDAKSRLALIEQGGLFSFDKEKVYLKGETVDNLVRCTDISDGTHHAFDSDVIVFVCVTKTWDKIIILI